MRTLRILDGLLGAIALALLLGLVARFRGLDLIAYSSWLFLAGVALLVVFGVWGLLGGDSPPGLLVLLGRRPAEPPSEAPLVEGIESAEDAAEPERGLGREIWIDRIITTRNVWVTSGFLLLGASFLLLFLG